MTFLGSGFDEELFYLLLLGGPRLPGPSIFISGVRNSISIRGVFGMPSLDPISFPCGARRTILWTYTEEQDPSTLQFPPIDLSNVAEIIFTATTLNTPVSDSSGSRLIVQKKLSTGGIVISDAAAGQALITFQPADTSAFPAGQYFYDVKVIFNDDVTDDDFPNSGGTFTLTDHSSR